MRLNPPLARRNAPLFILDNYGGGALLTHPQPEDIFLLIEVADTTVQYDRQVKIRLYAEENIAEVWLVDINGQCVEVYREPASDGYQNIQKFERSQTLSILAFPDVIITVNEVLGQ